MKRGLRIAAVAGVFLLASCGPAERTGVIAPETRDALFARGHALYLQQRLEEAERDLRRAAAMDSTYADPLVDLGSLYYDLGSREGGGPARRERFETARNFLVRADGLGATDVYDRLCELCSDLHDPHGFLKYARKNAERYPFDRQYYNLGVACFGVEDWAGVVKSQREALGKFRESPYIGAFYRQMGRAYMKMERDQTAERTLAAGVQAVDGRIALMRKGPSGNVPGELERLKDDKIGMLLLLKRLHTTYREAEKLAEIERQLREAGYTK